MSQICVRNNNRKQVVLPTKDIIRVEASNNYSKIYFTNARPLTVAKVLHWFEMNLPGDSFYRIHQTHIINRYFVKEVQCNNTLELTTGERIQGSRRKKPVLKMMLKEIAGNN
ncbi:MAG: LytTR family DNA-binding domain-containing protein [Bacteroidota bacterium]